MDFVFSDEQEEIRSLVARVFDDSCSDEAMKGLVGKDKVLNLHTMLWEQLAELGVLGVAIDEARGGLGMGLVELCLILEQQGRKAAPLPILDTCATAALTIQEADRPDVHSELLPKIAAGKYIFSLVSPYRGLQSAAPLSISAKGKGFVLNGRSGFGAYLDAADGYLICSSDADEQQAILWLSAGASGVEIIAQTGVSDEPGGYLRFTDAEVGADQVVAVGDAARSLLARQSQRRGIAIAAMQTGILDEGLKRAAEYVSERQQFGRPLGAFQAVSQQAADAYMEIESLRSVYWRALDDIADGRDLELIAAVSGYWVSRAAHKVAHTFLHLHGGIGQDLDYPIHRFFLRAKHYERLLGATDQLALQAGDILISQLDERLPSF